MLTRRSFRVKHIQFKAPPSQSSNPLGLRAADNDPRRKILEEDGHRIWGLVLYRSTYKSTADWAEFMRRLQFRTQEFIEIGHPPDLINSFRLTVMEDQAAFDGATTSIIREHFKQWTETAVEEEQGVGVRPRDAQRYQYCLQVDEDALETVVRQTPGLEYSRYLNEAGYVRLINKDWEPYDPVEYEDGKSLSRRNQKSQLRGVRCMMWAG
ncbi:hypothetical protein BJX63DRAFT_407186 [Aspergillus granulosus]|uniref:Uncharacterized protein n=1 Tax=Aspergillus granulosus TaxID=176169 RepID=A0ABR4H0L0_9EURO